MQNRRFTHITTSFLFIIILMMGVLLMRSNVSSESIPTNNTAPPSAITFNYQGHLLTNSGNAVNDTIPMTFKLYDALTGGTACWTEAHTSTNAVTVIDGVFTVLLGSNTSISDSCITGDLYLEVTVNNETLSPRELLSSVAYAVEASGLTGSLDMERDQIENVGAGNASMRIGSATTSGNAYFDLTEGDRFAFRDSQQDGAPILLQVESNGDISTGNISVHNGNGTIDVGNVTGAGSSGEQAKIHMPAGTNGGNMYLNWGTGRSLIFGGGEDIAKFSVATDGDVNITGNFEMDGTQVLRSADNNLYILPWSDNNISKVHIGGGNSVDLQVNGNLSVSGSCSAASTNSNSLAVHDASCTAGSITTGAVIEGNLQTVDERQNSGNDDFQLGDLLCWGDMQLELCDETNTPLVQAVADADGNPIVMGAEMVKVIGNVTKGQYLVASDVPGYAIATDNPTFGIVIAQALEDFEGEEGIILAMIRKM